MVKTHGLTHIALAVRDARRSLTFYRRVFGVVEVFNQGGFIQAQTPGSRDMLVFDESAKRTGRAGGIAHFGFRLTTPDDIDAAARAVARAGGKILSRGEFCPGEPYLFAADPDGYEVEIWFEPPTKVDPPARKAKRRDALGRTGSKAGRGDARRRRS